MPQFHNLIKATVTAAPGAGSFTPTGAASGYRTIAAVVATNEIFHYHAREGTAWEIGYGVWNGTTLTRNLIESSTGALISFGTGVVISSAAPAREIGAWPQGASPSAAGIYLPPDTQNFGTTAAAMSANLIVLYPFFRRARIDAVCIEITAALAGNFAGGLYRSNPVTRLPTTLIEQGTTISTGTVGIKASLLAAAREIQEPLWLATVFSAAPTVRLGAVNNRGNQFIGQAAFNTATINNGFTASPGSFTLPTTIGALTVGSFGMMIAARSA